MWRHPSSVAIAGAAILAGACVGCASAGKGNSIIGGITDGGPVDDSNDFPAIDASVIDAPPQQITLSQNTSTTITRGNSFRCRDTQTGATVENSYYRVFMLDDHAVRGTLHVLQVEIGIELADAGPAATEQPAKILLGTYGVDPGATLDLGQIRALSSIDVKIPDGAGTRFAADIAGDVAAGSRLIVELRVPDGNPAGSTFIIGSNAQGERRPGYTRAPECNISVPRTMLSVAREIGVGEADILLSVTGAM